MASSGSSFRTTLLEVTAGWLCDREWPVEAVGTDMGMSIKPYW